MGCGDLSRFITPTATSVLHIHTTKYYVLHQWLKSFSVLVINILFDFLFFKQTKFYSLNKNINYNIKLIKKKRNKKKLMKTTIVFAVHIILFSLFFFLHFDEPSSSDKYLVLVTVIFISINFTIIQSFSFTTYYVN